MVKPVFIKQEKVTNIHKANSIVDKDVQIQNGPITKSTQQDRWRYRYRQSGDFLRAYHLEFLQNQKKLQLNLCQDLRRQLLPQEQERSFGFHKGRREHSGLGRGNVHIRHLRQFHQFPGASGRLVFRQLEPVDFQLYNPHSHLACGEGFHSSLPGDRERLSIPVP